MKTDLFQSCGHCWVFQICWHIECSTFTVSSFRIWNSSIENPSPPLALFIVMLPKAHLTLHCRMSGSRWVITSSWLSGSWRSFLYSSSVYSCHLLLISWNECHILDWMSYLGLNVAYSRKNSPRIPTCKNSSITWFYYVIIFTFLFIFPPFCHLDWVPRKQNLTLCPAIKPGIVPDI